MSFSDLYGLWIILGAGLALGTGTMLTQRCLRRRSKQQGPGSDGDLPLSAAGPLPVEHQPLRLLVSAMSFGRLRSGRLRGGGRNGRLQRQQRQGGGVAAAAAIKDASIEGASAYGDTSCDLESDPSFSLQGKVALAPGTAAGAACGAAGRQHAGQAPSPAGAGGADGERPMRRLSSLQEAASIYSDIHWKSPRSSNHAGPG